MDEIVHSSGHALPFLPPSQVWVDDCREVDEIVHSFRCLRYLSLCPQALGEGAVDPLTMRVLLVDGEAGLVRGMQRRLSELHSVWECVYTQSGAGALMLLAREEFQAIVAEAALPDLDGVAFFVALQGRYPQVMRLALVDEECGHSLAQLSRLVHRVIAGPIPAAELLLTVDWLWSLLERLHAPEVQSRARAPHYTQVGESYQRLVHGESRSDVPSLVRAIRQSGLEERTRELLSLVHGQPALELERGISKVGVAFAKALYLVAHLFEPPSTLGLTRGGPAALDRVRAVRLATHLMSHCPSKLAAEAALAGLLLNVGELCWGATAVSCAGTPSAAPATSGVHRCADPDPNPTMAELGGALLERWGFPFCLVEAVTCQSALPASLTYASPLARLVAEALVEPGQPAVVGVRR